MCMMHESISEKTKNNKIKLFPGKTYIFENGEVMEERGIISLSMPWSGVSES